MLRILINTLSIFMAVASRDTIAVYCQNQFKDIKLLNVTGSQTLCNSRCVVEGDVLRDLSELLELTKQAVVNILEYVDYYNFNVNWLLPVFYQFGHQYNREGSRNALSYSPRTVGLTLRRLMSYTYGAPILDVSRSHTTTHHSR